jgi:hypothetical protein
VALPYAICDGGSALGEPTPPSIRGGAARPPFGKGDKAGIAGGDGRLQPLSGAAPVSSAPSSNTDERPIETDRFLHTMTSRIFSLFRFLTETSDQHLPAGRSAGSGSSFARSRLL